MTLQAFAVAFTVRLVLAVIAYLAVAGYSEDAVRPTTDPSGR